MALCLSRALRQKLHGLGLERGQPGADAGDDHSERERGGEHRRQPRPAPQPFDRGSEQVAQENGKGDGYQHRLRPVQHEDHRNDGQYRERSGSPIEWCRRGHLIGPERRHGVVGVRRIAVE
jgi:hypothetical protein